MSIYVGEARTISTSDMQGPAPEGFHVPTKDEWVALCGILTSTFRLTKIADMGTYLKIPLAGDRYNSNATIHDVGSAAFFWSSTAYDANNSYCLRISSSGINPQLVNNYGYGFPVRCFKNSPTIPTSSWTTLYQGSGSAGIFYNATDGLISVSGDGTTWYTIQDKNLGATTVFNQGDTVNDANSGYFYQWGNNYGFAHSGSVTTSSTKVNAQNYGPGNYYNSSTFITGSGNWSSVRNYNLRGGVTQGTSTTTLGIKNLYIGANEAKEVYVGVNKVRPMVKSAIIEFLLVGKGGDGGNNYKPADGGRYVGLGGGGGGGGEIIYNSSYEISGTIEVKVGDINRFGSIEAQAGGNGGDVTSQGVASAGGSGASGGGGATLLSNSSIAGGSGTVHNGGGRGYSRSNIGGAGGGGSISGGGSNGSNSSPYGGAGAAGYASDISGTTEYYGAGGGGGSAMNGGAGGTGGGGAGGYRGNGSDATTYGSGGGGAGSQNYQPADVYYGGKGKQGVLIIRYPTASGYNITGGDKYTSGSYTIHRFTSNGTLTVN